MPVYDRDIEVCARLARFEYNLSDDATVLLRTVLRIVFLNTRLAEETEPEELLHLVRSGLLGEMLASDRRIDLSLWETASVARRHRNEFALLHILQDRDALRNLLESMSKTGVHVRRLLLDKD
jgi:hypothetical protein